MIPFNEEVYFAIFADYNLEIWPMQPIAYLVGIILFGLARYPFPFSGRIVLAAIALCWIYMAQNYLAVFLSQLLWATWILQILFYLQALILLVVAILPSRPEIRLTANNEGWTAVAIAAFVMIFYPMIAAQTGGHAWPATQLAGVAPLPSAVLTIALMVLAPPRRAILLVVVPALVVLIGSLLAIGLGIWEDLVLAAVAAAGLWVLVKNARSTTPG